MSISIYNQTRSYSKEEEKAFSARVSEALAVLLSSSYIDKRLSSGDCDVSADIKLVGSPRSKSSMPSTEDSIKSRMFSRFRFSIW